MKKKVAQFIDTNEHLNKFITRIYNYSMSFKNDACRYLILVSLISSDNLVDKKSCEESIECMTFIQNNIDFITTDIKIREEVLKYMKEGIRIAKRDLKRFEKQQSTVQ